MSFHWPLNISNGSILVCEHKKELLHTCIPLIHLTKKDLEIVCLEELFPHQNFDVKISFKDRKVFDSVV